MEYEIGDDPQGSVDRPDGERDGGLRDDPRFFRKHKLALELDRLDRAVDKWSLDKQPGEVG